MCLMTLSNIFLSWYRNIHEMKSNEWYVILNKMLHKFENIKRFKLLNKILGPDGTFCDDNLTDVTLVSNDNKKIKAHKILISSASEVLK